VSILCGAVICSFLGASIATTCIIDIAGGENKLGGRGEGGGIVEKNYYFIKEVKERGG